ncbi:hypothetical protein LX16_3141 [Stackebrandtia albiflava]|uniref:Uncharacterized protein n=1 Tax=Stackebrandtia albiflava TaxID=406432 RepID=A0A562V3D0_9ACTN|nr:hypothetical protein [Stackebrandtia albiflava]TWJ12384.1 hypothetical protein LX16_3141 [Stackebrandtia albiflava]
MSRKTTVALSALVLLTATACGPSATFGGFETEAEAVIAEAMRDLATRPALHVTGDIPIMGGRSLSMGTFTATTLANGTSWAEFTNGGASGGMMSLPDGSTHVKAESAFWEAEAYSAEAAERFVPEWVTVNPTEWPHFGALFDPDTIGLQVFDEMAEAVESDLPEPTEADGIEVLTWDVSGGTVTITAQSPHRLVAVEEVMLSISTMDSGASFTGTVSIAPAPDDEVDAMREGVATALEGMTMPYTSTDTEMTMSDEWVECGGLIDCALGASSRVEFDTGHFPEGVEVVFTGMVEMDGLGTETCTESKALNEPDDLDFRCAVHFDDAEAGREYQYGWGFFANSFGRYAFDAEAMWESIAPGFD